MKRIWIVILLLLALLGCAGCGGGEADNVTFTALVESVTENTLLVTTADDVGFDRASVDVSAADMDFTPRAGQWVSVTILPEIRESYPVQVTAVSVRLLGGP